MINFDAPGDRDAYVHRVGRSGRAGRDGAGISFVMPDQDKEMRQIATSLGLASEYDSERPAQNGGGSGRPTQNGGSGAHQRSHRNGSGNGGGGGRRRRRRR